MMPLKMLSEYVRKNARRHEYLKLIERQSRLDVHESRRTKTKLKRRFACDEKNKKRFEIKMY